MQLSQVQLLLHLVRSLTVSSLTVLLQISLLIVVH
nr:MAG TPA: hypothetical protein [Caudoviricetes sp.]